MLAQLTNEQKQLVRKIQVPLDSISDEEIVVHIHQGNPEAYGSIMRRYNQRMFRIARSIVANDASAMDVVQESHIKAFTKLSDFKGPSTFLAWLYAITRNEALMFLRKHKKEVTMSNDEIHLINSDKTEEVTSIYPDNDVEKPDAYLENKQLQRLINKQVDSLPEDFRIVFVLRAIEQLSVRETAEILDIKEETVKTRYFRSKRLIRKKMQTLLDDIGMKVYEFGGEHCDVIIANVMDFISNKN